MRAINTWRKCAASRSVMRAQFKSPTAWRQPGFANSIIIPGRVTERASYLVLATTDSKGW